MLDFFFPQKKTRDSIPDLEYIGSRFILSVFVQKCTNTVFYAKTKGSHYENESTSEFSTSCRGRLSQVFRPIVQENHIMTMHIKAYIHVNTFEFYTFGKCSLSQACKPYDYMEDSCIHTRKYIWISHLL